MTNEKSMCLKSQYGYDFLNNPKISIWHLDKLTTRKYNMVGVDQLINRLLSSQLHKIVESVIFD